MQSKSGYQAKAASVTAAAGEKVLGERRVEIVCHIGKDFFDAATFEKLLAGLQTQRRRAMRNQIEHRLAVTGDHYRFASFDASSERGQAIFGFFYGHRGHAVLSYR